MTIKREKRYSEKNDTSQSKDVGFSKQVAHT